MELFSVGLQRSIAVSQDQRQWAPLTDAIALAVAQLVDDAQTDRRIPAHSDIGECLARCGLGNVDPNNGGTPVGKAKRIRNVLLWAIPNAHDRGRQFVSAFVEVVRGYGGFRAGSPHFAGEDAIHSLRDALRTEGFQLTLDGQILPESLDTLSGTELTDALENYVRRARMGAEDAALGVGTGKDLLEATAAHVLVEMYSIRTPPHQFPSLLGQAYAALKLTTSAESLPDAATPEQRLHRALFDAACAVNTLRNKQGTGHGRPWLPSVTPEEARHAVQLMGLVSDLLLRELRRQTGVS